MSLGFIRSAHAAEERIFARVVRSQSAADAAILSVWSELIAVIEAGGPPALIQVRLRKITDRLYVSVAQSLGNSLLGLAKETHQTTVDSLREHLPIQIHESHTHQFQRPVQEAAKPKSKPKKKAKEKKEPLQFILPAPSPSQLLSAVFRGNWAQRLAAVTKLASPEVLAAVISKGVLDGKTPAEIAREIRPVVQGVQTSALRIARTEGLRIAHTIQHDAYESLGDLVIGYQVHAVVDEATRPEHRRRDGFEYYKNPKPGQRPMSECPHPPMEANGTYAFNCRCYLTPIFGEM